MAAGISRTRARVAAPLWSMIAAMPPSTASRPYFPIILRKRRSPVRTAAIWPEVAHGAFRQTHIDLDDGDELLFGTPARQIFTIGICRLEKISVVALSRVPPTSGQCAMQQENNTTRRRRRSAP